MAASIGILAEMKACESRIGECGAEIQLQIRKPHRLEDSYQLFIDNKRAYDGRLDEKDEKRCRISRVSENSNAAKRYGEKMTPSLKGYERAQSEDRAYRVKAFVLEEIAAAEERLAGLRRSLRALEDELNGLGARYHNALRREEEERRAAVAAGQGRRY